MKKILFGIFLLFGTITQIQAQFRNGYIIMGDNSVQNGSIEREYNFFNGSFIKFKNEKGKVKKYSSSKIDGFVIEDTTYIVLKNLNFRQPAQRGAIINNDFVKVLVEGEISLYEFDYKSEQVWLYTPTKKMYIIKNQIETIHLSSDKREMEIRLADIFKKFEEMSAEITQVGVNISDLCGDLIRFTKAYNVWLKESKGDN